VKVRGGNGPVPGGFDETRTEWQSKWTLSPDKEYFVKVIAVDAEGRQSGRSSRFRTLKPSTVASCTIFEGSGLTYGVGMPVMLTFSNVVEDKKAVEEALSLKCSKKVVGAWYWDGDQALWFRPRNYWPQHVKVSFTGHLDGVQISPGVYLTHTLRQSWKIGRSLVVVASASEHLMKVYKDGKHYATWPISTGRPGKDTPNGTYLSIEKANPQHMVGPDYDLQVPYSVRFTWSGDFIHAAPWSVGSQGYANVSHGCVNVAPDHAATYYWWSIPGDPITVSGSPKSGSWDDGYTCWFLSWKELWQGSALHKAVRVGPDGSTLVKPSKIRPSHAKAPVAKPKPDNSSGS
jgi:lipoprotein-anchoring transpeptidase ErfK/SrfK